MLKVLKKKQIGSVNFQTTQVEKRVSPITWSIMIIIPIVLFFVSLFFGRYMFSPGDVLKIISNQVFKTNFDQNMDRRSSNCSFKS